MSLLRSLLGSNLRLVFHLEGHTFILARPGGSEGTFSHYFSCVLGAAWRASGHRIPEALLLSFCGSMVTLLTTSVAAPVAIAMSLLQRDLDLQWKGLKAMWGRA